MFTFSAKPIILSFDVVVLLETAKKSIEMYTGIYSALQTYQLLLFCAVLAAVAVVVIENCKMKKAK